MESKYYGEGKLKLTPQPLADLIGAQRVSVARWEIGMNEPKGANLKALRELQKRLKRKRSGQQKNGRVLLEERLSRLRKPHIIFLTRNSRQ